MARLGAILCFLVLLPASVRGENAATVPEQLLSRETVLYFRYDGLESHRKAYEQTAMGEVMKGELGEFVDYVIKLVKDSLGPVLVKGQLLEGTSPEQMKHVRNGFTQFPSLVETLSRNGLLIGVEIIDPTTFRAQLTVVFPNGGQEKNKKALDAGLRMAAALGKVSVKESKTDGRAVTEIDPKSTAPVRIAWWPEGNHLVFTLGTADLSHTVGLAARKRPSLLEHPLYKSLAGFKKYETAARGFVDLERVTKLAGIYPPAGKLIDQLGLRTLKSVTAQFGFEGRQQRSTVVVNFAGPRQGIWAALASGKDLDLAQLPPIPPDVTGFQAVQVDFPAVYDAVLQAIAGISEAVAPEQKLAFPVLQAGVDQALGFDMKKDLLGTLGPTVLFYTSPAEGPLSLGFSVVIQVKDAAKLQESLSTLYRSLPAALGADISVKKQSFRGVDLQVLRFAQQGFFLLPTLAIHNDWLVLGLFPQNVQGFIMRNSGKYSAWKPSAQTEQTLAAARKLAPNGRVLSLGVSDPRPSFNQLCTVAPFVGGLANSFAPGSFDVSKIPNAQSITEPLFPNVSMVVDDGDGIRMESYDSFSLPLNIASSDSFLIAVFSSSFVFRFFVN